MKQILFDIFHAVFTQISPSTMRYYEQKYPEVDELVMVQVRQIAEMGAYVKLVSDPGFSLPQV